jgi:hypothetical protein
MKIGMKAAQSSNFPHSKFTKDLFSALCTAQDILKSLSQFNTLQHDDLLDGLTKLMDLSSRELKEFSEFNDAITLCWRAEYYNLGKDPLIEEWASWPERHTWLHLELNALTSKINGTKTDVEDSAGLTKLRAKYQDDGEGYPKDIWHSYDKHQDRKNLAYARSDLYALGELIEQAEKIGTLDLLEFSTMVQTWCSEFGQDECDKKLRPLLNYLQRCSPKERIPVAWCLYSECLSNICSSADSLYAALIGKPSEVIKEFCDNTRISLFGKDNPLPVNLWEELNQAQQAFRESSSNFPLFDISELKELSEAGRFDIVSIRYRDRFTTAGLIMSDNSVFLPRTQEKLSKFGELTLRPLNIHSWQFLNVADPHALLSLRHLRVDWSLILRDAITDISLVRGREDILGIVELDNHAMKSHRRLGFVPLTEDIHFQSDGGKSASIQRRSLYNPFSE